jgi:hypothetical protein
VVGSRRRATRPVRPRERRIRLRLDYQVRAIAGSPGVVRAEHRLDETLWIYSFTDEWSHPSEFDVSFDRTGAVADISTERLHY